MTTPRVATFKTGNGRYYTHPNTGEKVPGVTSIINKLPKEFLKWWAAKEVASTAVDALADPSSNWLQDMARNDREAAIDFLKRSPDRNTRAAADIGSAAHGIFEARILGRPIGDLTEELTPFLRQFDSLLDAVQPEPLFTERTVWSTTHQYGGSFDLFANVSGEPCWIDNKTTRSGVHAEVALQLSAYSHADFMIDTDAGKDVPLPQGKRGLVFHVRPDQWAIYEVPIGDEVFAHFLALRETFKWDAASRTIVGKPLVTGAAEAKVVIA